MCATGIEQRNLNLGYEGMCATGIEQSYEGAKWISICDDIAPPRQLLQYTSYPAILVYHPASTHQTAPCLAQCLCNL